MPQGPPPHYHQPHQMRASPTSTNKGRLARGKFEGKSRRRPYVCIVSSSITLLPGKQGGPDQVKSEEARLILLLAVCVCRCVIIDDEEYHPSGGGGARGSGRHHQLTGTAEERRKNSNALAGDKKGRYKCRYCGEIKSQHVCPALIDIPRASMGTQVDLGLTCGHGT